MSNYDHVAAIYDFAKEHGYKVKNFNTAERRNQRGRYNYVTLAFIVPVEEPEEQPRRLEDFIAEVEAAVNENSADSAESNEV